jgi:pyruvate/2-oxoglutarate dehydrogenase complex dihydrolipoamide dehydrogenase (E3) component
MQPDTSFDVIVIGGGSAGTSAASAAHATGARVAMVNDGELGGLCILRGCMPTKTLLQSTHLLHEMRTAEAVGVHAGGIGYDFGRIMKRKNDLVLRFKNAKLRSIESGGYEVIAGRARFVDGETIAVGDRRFRARGYVIATGSVPSIPSIRGIESISVMTSDDVMRLEAPPASMLIQGAGPIGLELGQFFARLGTRVLLVNRSAPLSRIDPDMAAEMAAVLRAEPDMETLMPGVIEEVARNGSGIRFALSQGGRSCEHRAGAFLAAAGRSADIAGLGLEAAGVDVGGNCIVHDSTMRTTNPAIYIAGDATGCHQILHLANMEGRVAGHNAAAGRPDRTMDYRLRMAVIFTDPPFATVGMTEGEARAAGRVTVTASKRFPEQGRAITMATTHGLAKVVADVATGEILGCQILGPRADDLIHIPAAVMHFRGSAADLAALPWYHPTLAEAFIEIARDLVRATCGKEAEGCEPATPPA